MTSQFSFSSSSSSFSFSFLVAVAALLLFQYSLAHSGPGSGLEFSYSGDTGPAKWGSLSPEYAECTAGKSQSPINIVTNKAVLNRRLTALCGDYHPVNATLINNVHSVAIQLGNAGALKVDGKSYYLEQIHWHSPSEHKINGVSFKAELHLVHKANDGSISVVGIPHRIGAASPILAKIPNQLVELVTKSEIPIGTFDARQLRLNNSKYYRYVGSFTTPPCSENVIWHISNEVRTLSRGQLKNLLAPLPLANKRNRRPVQPLNGRVVQLFDN